MSPNAGGRGGGGFGVPANEYSWAHGAQINFGDLTPYLTYDSGLTDAFFFGMAHTAEYNSAVYIIFDLLSYFSSPN